MSTPTDRVTAVLLGRAVVPPAEPTDADRANATADARAALTAATSDAPALAAVLEAHAFIAHQVVTAYTCRCGATVHRGGPPAALTALAEHQSQHVNAYLTDGAA
jgi:hypothetical protein